MTIIDERTGAPVDYLELLREAEVLAEERGCVLSTACRIVAESASLESSASIERQFRRMRSGSRQVAAVETGPAPVGVWCLGSELQRYAESLESQFREMENGQTFSAHRVRTFLARAERLEAVALDREAHLNATPDAEAVAALRPILRGFDRIDPEMAPELFVGGERRLVSLILRICSRVIHDASSALEWLE